MMNRNLLLAFGLSLAAFSLHAEEKPSLEQRVSKLEEKSIVGQPARPTKNATGVFFTGEALLWKPEQAGLEFATTTNAAFNKVVSIAPKTRYKWGFRLGIGYGIGHDAWDLYADWAHFRTNFTKQAIPPTGGVITPLLTSQGQEPVDTASSRFKLNFDMFDFEIGRQFYISKFLSLRPFIGARGAIVNEGTNTTYTGANFAALGVSPDVVTFKNNFWGVGARIGLNTQWELYKGLSFYGNAAASVLAGRYHLSAFEQAGIPLTFITSNGERYDVSKFVYDLQVGLSWGTTFASSYHLELLAGWESHFFSNMWQWLGTDGSTPTPNGDLSLSGFNFGARLDF